MVGMFPPSLLHDTMALPMSATQLSRMKQHWMNSNYYEVRRQLRPQFLNWTEAMTLLQRLQTWSRGVHHSRSNCSFDYGSLNAAHVAKKSWLIQDIHLLCRDFRMKLQVQQEEASARLDSPSYDLPTYVGEDSAACIVLIASQQRAKTGGSRGKALGRHRHNRHPC